MSFSSAVRKMSVKLKVAVVLTLSFTIVDVMLIPLTTSATETPAGILVRSKMPLGKFGEIQKYGPAVEMPKPAAWFNWPAGVKAHRRANVFGGPVGKCGT